MLCVNYISIKLGKKQQKSSKCGGVSCALGQRKPSGLLLDSLAVSQCTPSVGPPSLGRKGTTHSCVCTSWHSHTWVRAAGASALPLMPCGGSAFFQVFLSH